jgi:hypothetical protein
MAQAIKNKDVRKNCVDVEKVIMECLLEPEREDNLRKLEPVEIKKLSKELSKYTLRNNALYNQEIIPINRVKQNLVYKNYYEYNR